MKNYYTEEYYKTNNYKDYLQKEERYYKLAVEINDFFDKQWQKMQSSMRDRINDNFQVLKQAS